MPSYSFLKTDIINTIENDSTEFENQIPFLIEKAEGRLIKELDDPSIAASCIVMMRLPQTTR